MTVRRYKVGNNREQADLFGVRLDDYVGEDNPVRAIDVYIDVLDLAEHGFTRTQPTKSEAGQPPYPPAALLKLYLYGYLNRVRSSRRLESETLRNVEMMWLLEGLRPSYKTIADFRKDNTKALRRVQADFVQLCKELGLFGGKRVGVDGSFFKGNVSKKSFQTDKKLAKRIARLEAEVAAWHRELDAADRSEAGEVSGQADPLLAEKLKKLEELQQEHQTAREQRGQLKDRGKSHTRKWTKMRVC